MCVAQTSFLSLALIALIPATALGGMPAPYTLSELGKMRLDGISFFLLLLALSSGLIQLIWNSLRDAFPRLPRLNYWRALGLVVLWGLLFNVVLTMIAGGRELMTPGAWEKQGTTYKLSSGGK